MTASGTVDRRKHGILTRLDDISHVVAQPLARLVRLFGGHRLAEDAPDACTTRIRQATAPTRPSRPL